LRDAALYVSVGDDYAAVTPNRQITPEQATDAVRFVKEMVSYTEKMETITGRRGLLEVRSSLTGNRIARVLFCIHSTRMVLLHGFIKKTKQTPDADLDLAMKRKKELER